MTRRLDVASALTLIGEDKFQEELDRNTWYYLHIRNEMAEYPDGVELTSPQIGKFKRFKTEANPIVYLIYNDIALSREFGVQIAGLIAGQLGFNNEDELIDWIMDDMWEITQEYADAIWNVIMTQLSHEEIKKTFNYINNGNNDIFFIFDKDQNQVFPNLSDEFLNKWFPKYIFE